MATNKSTIKGLKKMSKKIDELTQWNKLLKAHIRTQISQKGSYPEDDYKVDTTKKKISRTKKGRTQYSY